MKRVLVLLLFFSGYLITVLSNCQSEQELNYSRYYINGKGLYEQKCENCHGKTGEGLSSLIPPLSDTTYLKNNKSKLACIIKYGLADTIQVNGKIYSEKMPANLKLSNIEVAYLITYVSNSFSNKQGLYTVDDAAKDLSACQK